MFLVKSQLKNTTQQWKKFRFHLGSAIGPGKEQLYNDTCQGAVVELLRDSYNMASGDAKFTSFFFNFFFFLVSFIFVPLQCVQALVLNFTL